MPAQLYLSYCYGLFSEELTEKIQLISVGKIMGNDGRGFNNSNPQANLDFFTAKQHSIPLDIEHASKIKAQKASPHRCKVGSTSLKSSTVLSGGHLTKYRW